MKIRTLAAALVVSIVASCGYATEYYVDAVNGNDANSGLALGEGNAMESFAALFAIAKPNEIWYHSLQPAVRNCRLQRKKVKHGLL